jgi:hypothetical protein
MTEPRKILVRSVEMRNGSVLKSAGPVMTRGLWVLTIRLGRVGELLMVTDTYESILLMILGLIAAVT